VKPKSILGTVPERVKRLKVTCGGGFWNKPVISRRIMKLREEIAWFLCKKCAVSRFSCTFLCKESARFFFQKRRGFVVKKTRAICQLPFAFLDEIHHVGRLRIDNSGDEGGEFVERVALLSDVAVPVVHAAHAADNVA
jgi:hypothetical protein